jgi:membrane protease YdiL (CAAX protease family)
MIQLGENPWVLILLSTLEVLLLIIPIFLSSRVSQTTLKQELHLIGMEISLSYHKKKLAKATIGVAIGAGLVLLSPYILYFYRDLVIASVFHEEFVTEGIENAINTQPLTPNLLQLVILVLIQFFIIGPCEEGFFRGFVTIKLKGRLKLRYTMLVSSTLFALFHVPPFIVPLSTIISYFGYYFVIGFILAIVYVYSNFSLLPGSLAHSFFNFLILLI